MHLYFRDRDLNIPAMGKDLADQFPVAKQVFEEANDALGFDLARMCFSGSDEDLKLTANTQPAILATSVRCAAGHAAGDGSCRALRRRSFTGGIFCVVAAGALTLADAVKTVRQRGTFMQEAVPVGVGAMAAVMGVETDLLVKICQDAAQGEVVAPANFNSAGQIVIAGHAAAVERALELVKEQGAKRALLLPVSAPFHSSLMKPAALRLETALQSVAVAELACPVVSNVEAKPYQAAERVKPLLVEQVCAPVQWIQSVEEMNSLGVTEYIEIGPGKVLCGLIKRIARDAILKNMESVDSLAKLTA